MRAIRLTDGTLLDADTLAKLLRFSNVMIRNEALEDPAGRARTERRC